MKKHITVLFLLFSFVSLFSQEVISENPLRLKGGLSDRRESIPIINSVSKELSLFIVDRKTMYLNKYDKTFNLLDQLKFERPKTQAKNIIDAVESNNGQYLFLVSNNSKKKLELITIDSQTKTTDLITTPILSKNERYLEAFAHKNQIFILTLIPKTSKINVHKIKKAANIETLEYDLTNEIFFDKYDKPMLLYRAFASLNSSKLNIERIESDIPNALEASSKKTKLYIQDDRIILSLDISNRYSQLITLDLKTNSFDLTSIEKPQLDGVNRNNKQFVKSNSFLSKKLLYQISGMRGEMKFNVTDLDSKKIIKEITLQKEDSISFKNTPIIQEGGYYNSHREMEKTQKFLRKIALSNIAVSVLHKQDTIRVTLGGVKEIAAGGGGFGMPMVGFGAIGGAVAGLGNTFVTPTFYAYSGYTHTKSTRIDCLFDENITHVQGEVAVNAFDHIKEFSDGILFNKKAETVFKFNDYFIHGYYNSLHKKYFLRKFED
ncbi:hypothetical protein AWE51_19445 [Aquimarina aggregata]|uniref:Uncharacterized protein n=1 Tax=Aquimarina aggregata TaxID=1642818 RepID=A0A162WNW8_9FLAO|nr:hypothetical protein [Aquimarina aggregata]KZS38213.1 hypothetical protein AWE51_19445 [Aquimarina aggregata]